MKKNYYLEKPYTVSADEVVEKLSSSLEGLTAGAVQTRRKATGPNRLPQALKEGLLKRFFKHFNDLLIYILIVAGIITAVMNQWVDTGVILAVVVINAVIGFIQEGKAEQALAGIRKLLSLNAHARRDGEWMEIEAEDLVPGDIVRVRSGDRVPADIRLIETTTLRIEESALTGESEPAEKNTANAAEDAGVGDRHCMAYSGTLVTSGRGLGIVTATGSATEIGRINTMISDVEVLATPLTRRMNRFGKILSIVILGMAAVLFLIGRVLHGIGIEELFFAAIGFSVAAIPEGLPAIMTITLALGVQRMAKRNAITRKLNAVETLGSVTVICSDKTGTLTRNEMTVRHVVTSDGLYDVDGRGYEPRGDISRDGNQVTLDQHPVLQELIEVMALCNDSGIKEEDGQWRVVGEPTEGALISLARKAGFDTTAGDRAATIPFESENKFMATLHRFSADTSRILLKGAADRLLDRCTAQRAPDGSDVELDRAFWEKHSEELSSQGLRLLAAATRDADDGQSELAVTDLAHEMIFLGLVGIIDPPRREAIEAVKTCKQAGIRVKMITGDHLGTATAIGNEMGIGDGTHAVTGADIEAASDAELGSIARENDIFARTSPEHKLRLVKALQADNAVVAMTGDGVNDAPALKRADVGIAMGIKGTEATKEAAEIVLADDNFASIERAVEEGRAIYDNLRKAIIFILPTNGAEALVILGAIVVNLADLPLTPVQILWVNMVTAVTLALALAFEPAEPGLMDRPPRAPDAPILGRMFVWRLAFVSALVGGATIAVFLVARHTGLSLELARTLAINTLVCGQAFYLFNSRYLQASSLSFAHLTANPAAWVAVGALAMLQIGFVYLPLMQDWFGTAPASAIHWLISLGIGAIVFLLVEAEKALVRR